MLDLWVAKALGDRLARIVGAEEHERCETRFGEVWAWNRFMPSRAWMDGGPIIERERIAIEVATESVWMAEKWIGEEGAREDKFVSVTGATPLIAAMRCYVESKFGEEVPD